MTTNYFKVVHQNGIVSLHFFNDRDRASANAAHMAALDVARTLQRPQIAVWSKLPWLSSVREVGEATESGMIALSS